MPKDDEDVRDARSILRRMGSDELKAICRDYGFSTSGSDEDLRKRIFERDFVGYRWVSTANKVR